MLKQYVHKYTERINRDGVIFNFQYYDEEDTILFDRSYRKYVSAGQGEPQDRGIFNYDIQCSNSEIFDVFNIFRKLIKKTSADPDCADIIDAESNKVVALGFDECVNYIDNLNL